MNGWNDDRGGVRALRALLALTIVSLAGLALPPASARTWYVTEDGLGDAPTIQAAADSSSPGDSILVGAGTYLEAVVLADETSLIGESGAAATTIDADGGYFAVYGVDALVSRLTLTGAMSNGYGYGGYAAGLLRGEVVGCRFPGSAEAAYVEQSGSFVGCWFETALWLDGDMWPSDFLVEGCLFEGVSAGATAVVRILGGAPMATAAVRGCVFADCAGSYVVAYERDGPDPVMQLDLEVSGNLFVGNTAGQSCVAAGGFGVPGPIVGGTVPDVQFRVIGNTFARNTVLTANAVVGDEEFGMDLGAVIERNVITGSPVGIHVPEGADATVSCNLLYANGQDFVGTDFTGLDGNLAESAVYCDSPGGDFYVAENSPCLPANNSCGAQIGAFGQGCGPLSLEARSWARIKAAYR